MRKVFFIHLPVVVLFHYPIETSVGIYLCVAMTRRMDVFELRWSIQKLVPSKAYLQAGRPNDMFTDQHLKWHLIKEKGPNQTIQSFIAEVQEMEKATSEDIKTTNSVCD